MNFKDKYQEEMKLISPTEEQLERIQNVVADRLADNRQTRKKKPLYLKAAAISGASVCAAAVLIAVLARGTHLTDHLNAAAPNNALGMASGDAAGDDRLSSSQAQSIDCGIESTDKLIPDYSDDSNSICDASPSMSNNTGTPTMIGSSSLYEMYSQYGLSNDGTPLLIFSEDMKNCTAVIDSKQRDYKFITFKSINSAILIESFREVYANIDEKPFVNFDEDEMLIYFKGEKTVAIYSPI